MSNPGDNGSWNQSNDPYGQPGQPSASDPYGQPGQPSASDPYGQPGQPSASDPYGQPQQPAGGTFDQSYGSPAGVPADGPVQAPTPAGQNRLVLGLLGIFLGGYGVHRFMMGYTTIGIIQIVVTLFTCGIGAIWGLIEGIMILAKVDPFNRDAHGRPLVD
ncbi:NINE protein [Brachybacterium sp. p3-SID1565]|uniref:TM2 domain-containing protein n=1 Tax=Brachybacterium sp. p3-SID1565 TaxID=2916046 RepID=UPI0021A60461|nr:TM2 domain-containing protein [Brachybacterium sp. p3-SID1565]MCT1384909.1 NINE protein [Brachybacterium sp. p3-SID1565]